MGTNYRQRLREQGRPLPPGLREQRRQARSDLEMLLDGWKHASDDVKAEFLSRSGLSEFLHDPPEPPPGANVLTAEETDALNRQIAEACGPEPDEVTGPPEARG